MRSRKRVSNGRPWGQREIERMKHLHDVEHKTWSEVGVILNRSACSCSSKYAYELSGSGRQDNHKMVVVLDVPQSVLIDRDRRANAPRSLSATFFGDPPRGYSALDRMGRT